MTGDPRFQFLISIHALLAESDSVRRKPKALLGNFYPRSPCGERPTRKRAPAYSAKFLSTLSLRRATLAFFLVAGLQAISIHALLAESDIRTYQDFVAVGISIHALLAESDSEELQRIMIITAFLSTLSLRRATNPFPVQRHDGGNFYPRSPCGERRVCFTPRIQTIYFYPRSPCGERHLELCGIVQRTYFYPRSPCGERLDVVIAHTLLHDISIHALLAESDAFWSFVALKVLDFYPRSPCGERHQTNTGSNESSEFLSTLSLRRATFDHDYQPGSTIISIHALLAESDETTPNKVG